MPSEETSEETEQPTASRPEEAGQRVGVFLCECRGEIGDRLDLETVAAHARDQPDIVDVWVHEALCSEAGQQFITDNCEEEAIDRVVIGACTPKTYELIIRRAIENAGLNKYLYEQVNLREQCAWIHEESPRVTDKGCSLIASGIARARELEPLEDVPVDILPSTVVIGGGVAGMEAALDIARAGYQVFLVEREEHLGGRAFELSMTFPTHNCGICCVQSCKMCALTPKIEDLEQQPNIEVLLNSSVRTIQGGLGHRYVTLDTPDGERVIEAGTIVIATGSRVFDPSRIPEYGYENDDVITTLELERLIWEEREHGGDLRRPSDGQIPKVVNFVQCVGSRDVNRGNAHCSLVCCTYAIGQAREIKHRHPDTEVYIHFIDLRGPYRGFEEFCEEAKIEGVQFVRGRVAEVIADKGGLEVRSVDVDIGDPISIESDLVVLSVGQESRPETLRLADILHLELDIDDFIKDVNPMLTPEMRRGVFVAGTAQGPKGIRYSVEDARSAATLAIELMGKGRTTIENRVSVVDESRCIGCGRCAEQCEFGAAELHELEGGRLVSRVDPILCRGCGACSATCCNKAISVHHYRRKQIIPMIEAALRGVVR